MTLTQAIQAETRHLGFALVGVTTPEPPPHYPVFEKWLNAGRHAEMAYLDRLYSRQRRADPRLILPECRSILILGIHYPSSVNKSLSAAPTPANRQENPLSSILSGRVASYAWGEDYHLSLPRRLKALAAFIESRTGKPVAHRFYTDSGPVLERDLAQRAGLGWIGKNTHLINPQWGSYFLLAEILLGIDLDISKPFDHDRCGTCQRCQKSCPTSCILPDRTLDASRCISYLTIELKGAIPQAMRPRLSNWIFGCDICQQVCPWNQQVAAPVIDEIFTSQPNIPCPDLIEALSLDVDTFAQRFRSSPIKRAKRDGYLRNAAVALGNQLAEIPSHKDRPLAVKTLNETLQFDPSPLVRSHAAWALGRAGERKILRFASRHEKDMIVLNEIRFADTMGE